MASIITAIRIPAVPGRAEYWRADACFPASMADRATSWARSCRVDSGASPETIAVEVPDDEARAIYDGRCVTLREMDLLADRFKVVARFEAVGVAA